MTAEKTQIQNQKKKKLAFLGGRRRIIWPLRLLPYEWYFRDHQDLSSHVVVSFVVGVAVQSI